MPAAFLAAAAPASHERSKRTCSPRVAESAAARGGRLKQPSLPLAALVAGALLADGLGRVGSFACLLDLLTCLAACLQGWSVDWVLVSFTAWFVSCVAVCFSGVLAAATSCVAGCVSHTAVCRYCLHAPLVPGAICCALMLLLHSAGDRRHPLGFRGVVSRPISILALVLALVLASRVWMDCWSRASRRCC